MEAVQSLADILANGGPWTMTSILMVVVWRLWVKLDEKEEKILGLLDRQNEILKALDRLDRRD